MTDDEIEKFDKPMTATWLVVYLADEFHDWIDGDDWPEDSRVFLEDSDVPEVVVTFASGKRFSIAVQELR